MNISVLISIYRNDEPTFFKEALNSILNQTIKPTEIVIIKDGPVTAELAKIVNEFEILYSSIKSYQLDRNIGLSGALNYGLTKCNYELVARMDSDDISLPDRFERQLAFLKENPNVSLLGGWYRQYNEDMTKIITDRKVPESHDQIVKYAKTRTPFNHVTAIFKKTDVLKVGGYPEDVPGRLEDWWLALRLIKGGYKLHNLQEYLVNVRGGEDFLRRRGGREYISWEIKNLYLLYKESHLTKLEFLKNVLIKTIVRIQPSFLRKHIYFLIRKVR